ncbi:MAG: SPOR domain-containing protein [Nitrospirae bacterium]|nr:SPOR domain-containing protein [Nitrospirota bacterium]
MVIGAVVITIASFGLGYFFGYKGGDTSETEKQAVDSTKARETASSEDKRVIESSVAKEIQGKPVVAQAPVKQPQFAPEIPSPKLPEPGADKQPAKAQKAPEARERADKVQSPEPVRNEGKDSTGSVKADAESPVDTAHSPKVNTAKTGDGKHVKGKIKKRYEHGVTSKKVYTVQIGAFPNKSGAEQLYQSLKAKGYNPYIVDAGQNDTYFRVRVGTFKNKKDAERSALALSKQTGLQNFVTHK